MWTFAIVFEKIRSFYFHRRLLLKSQVFILCLQMRLKVIDSVRFSFRFLKTAADCNLASPNDWIDSQSLLRSQGSIQNHEFTSHQWRGIINEGCEVIAQRQTTVISKGQPHRTESSFAFPDPWQSCLDQVERVLFRSYLPTCVRYIYIYIWAIVLFLETKRASKF